MSEQRSGDHSHEDHSHEGDSRTDHDPGDSGHANPRPSDQPELAGIPGAPRLVTDSRWRTVAWFALFLGLAISLYGSVLSGEFVFDDRKLIVENDELWESSGFDFEIFADRSDDAVRTNFRPVRFLSYAIDARLTQQFRGGRHADGNQGDPDPWFFHFQNILWHAANAFLVFALVRRLAGSNRPVGAALSIAFLFLVHPVHTESVAYVSGRRDVLFLFFYLLGLLIYVRARTDREPNSGLVPIRLTTVVGVTVCFAVAVLSKEMAATFPVSLVAVELLLSRQRGAAVRLPWGALAATIVTLIVLVGGVLASASPGGNAGYWGGSWASAFWTAARASWHYVGLFFMPTSLSVDYSFDAIPTSLGALDPWTGLVSLCAILVVLAVAVVAWRRGNTWLAVGVPLFYVLASPVSQIVLPHPERFAERYLYLPSLALFLVVAGVVRCFGRSGLIVACGVVLCLSPVAMLQTYVRLGDWQTAEALWKSATETHPDCARAQYAYANQLNMTGQRELALEHANRAVQLLAPLEVRDSLQQGYFLQAWTLRITLHALSDNKVELALREIEQLEDEMDTDGQRLSDNAVLLFEKMKLEIRLAKMDRAKLTAQRIVRLGEPAAVAFKAQLFVAGYHESRRDIHAAWNAIEGAVAFATTDDERALLAYQRGLHFETQSLWKRARESYRTAAEVVGKNGKWESARWKEAECLDKLGHPEEAAALLRTTLRERPEHWPSVLTLAKLDMDADRFDAAQTGLVRLLGARPNSPEATHLLKMLAVRKAREAGELEGPSARTRLQTLIALARDKIDANEMDKAKAAVEKAAQLEDGDDQHALRLDLYLTMGELAVRGERWDEAASAYRLHLSRATVDEKSAAILQYGECLRKLGKTRSALDELTAYWNEGVRHPRLAKNLGGLAVAERDAKAALGWYRRYLEQEGLTEREKASVTPTVERLERLVESEG